MRNRDLGFMGIGGGGLTKLCFGQVKDNADPAQHGRLKIWIPSIDHSDYNVEDLSWATYVSPFAGSTANFKTGRESVDVPGVSSYGFWAIPKNGAQVLCGFLEGDSSCRFWLGCFHMPELNRTLPQAINKDDGPSGEIDESGVYPQVPFPHYQKNLKEAGLGVGTDHYKTRGGWERSISHPSNKNKKKPDNDGYAKNPQGGNAESQIHSFTTPGRHYMIMSDVADNCKIKFKTTEGTQIIMDDTNERVYISTAMGRNWIELDETNGKIYFYTASKLSVHSENDINMYSDSNINIVAKNRVNIKSEDRAVKIQSKLNTEILSTDANIRMTASRELTLKTTDGPKGDAVDENTESNQPPYAKKPMGLVRDWKEEGGAEKSQVLIDTIESMQVKTKGTFFLTTQNDIGIRSYNTQITLQSHTQLGIKTGNFQAQAPDIGFTTKDPCITVKWNDSYKYYDASDDFDGSNSPPPGYEPPGQRGPGYNSDVGAAGSAGDAPAVESDDVKSKMIVPNHESWKRDEDEGQCKTPRNKNYQG